MIEPSVLLERSTYLVLNKPAGFVVNESVNAHGNMVLQEWIQNNMKFELSSSSEKRSGIVHRLDKETSGVILVAKTQEAFSALQEQFASRTVEKTYVALVHGSLTGNGTITAKVGRLPWNRRKFGVIPEGRDAVTNYKVIKSVSLENEKYTLLELTPETGRTHQLRIHLKHIGHPIVSDPLYVGRKTLRKDLTFCPRLFLHAKSIRFIDPQTKKAVFVDSDLPADLNFV